MYIRPAHFDLPCADRLTQSTASQAVYRLARGYKYVASCSSAAVLAAWGPPLTPLAAHQYALNIGSALLLKVHRLCL
jgi:hypothetical protein